MCHRARPAIRSDSLTARAARLGIGKWISDRIVAGCLNFFSFLFIQFGEKKEKE